VSHTNYLQAEVGFSRLQPAEVKMVKKRPVCDFGAKNSVAKKVDISRLNSTFAKKVDFSRLNSTFAKTIDFSQLNSIVAEKI